jgi:calcineurin-like phosphoesterase family protein
MSTVWVISDTHFDHTNMLGFTNPEGQLIRPGFKSVDEMNWFITDAWNSRVRPQDKVYHMGDVAMKRSGLDWVRRLNGHKRLIRGNHDIYSTQDYLDAGFEEVHGMRILSHMVLTHAPLHPAVMARWRGNIHGHIHERPSPPGPYLNVSVEAVSYLPITLEEALSRMPPHPGENRPEWL